ncbi:MAG: hypothetical protein GW867_01395 [Armatimonadetes bacterium]|nr:hypothetical protein [Armatimonadota bacterium]
MSARVFVVAGWIAAGLLVGACAAQDQRTASFDDANALTGWQVEGAASVDAARSHREGGGSLRVGPGGKAIWKLRDTNGSGTVDFWVYEDASAPAKPKERVTGPYYGAMQADGRVLASGSLYAPYLSGDTTYALTAFNPLAKEQPYFAVQYLGLKRTEGWHQWTLTFDPDRGVTVKHDGKDVNDRQERFKWFSTKVEGFTGLVVVGDTTPDANQTVWIDDVNVALGGPMKVKPEQLAPPPPPLMTPETDPVPAEPARLREKLRNVHPRLLFGPEDIPAMKEKIKAGYGKGLFDRLLAYLPSCQKPDHTNFLKDATDGQRQGFWRLPTVALHYVLTGDKQSFDRTVAFMRFLMGLENWETGAELDSGMSSANIMVGAALAYDWLYNDLDPAFRAQYRDKLLLMARRQYHQGHLMKLPGNHYWQGDPANNHRFHRNAGMTLAILAAAEDGKTDDDWLLTKTLEELRFVAQWLPEDGTCHESPTYSVFGNTHLVLAMDAAQRCFGEPLLDHPFFKAAPLYKLQTMQPDLKGVFGYGDSGGGTGGYHNYLHRLCAHHKLSDEQAGLAEAERRNESFYEFAWFSVIWWQPLEGGALESLPRHVFYPDLGLAYCRTGWQASDVGAMFKCGPFGGYKLNEYRHRNAMKYVNVAHDDPDANSFVLFADGEMLAETDRYSGHKRSANHNTVLINGAGQVAAGRPEGSGWSQPGGDMSVMGVVTSYARNGNTVAVEGEAAGSYLANPQGGPKRPALDRYRRTFLWIEGQYLLVLDDIRAPAPVDVTWLMQGPELDTVDATGHRYVLKKGQAQCPFQVAATQPVTAETVTSPADNRGEALGWKQLRLTAETDAIRLASVYDPWHRGDLTVTFQTDSPDHGTVTVTGPGLKHSWDWTAGQDRFGPSKVTGRDANGGELLAMSAPEPKTQELLNDIRRLGQLLDMRRAQGTASDWEQKARGGLADFPPANTVDGKLDKASSWRAEGDGQWIQYDLKSAQHLAGIELAFVEGANRRYTFSLETSPDGETWTTAHKGESSGKTEGFERLDLDAPEVRCVRIVGHGNTNEKFKDWINLTEVRLYVGG